MELITEHNTGWRRYWGSEGHYTIAALACAAVRDPALRSLMLANQDVIAFDVTQADSSQIKGRLRQAQSGAFIPLADVPAPGAIGQDALRALYADPQFVLSLDLDHIGSVLSAAGPEPSGEPPRKRRGSPTARPRRSAAGGP